MSCAILEINRRKSDKPHRRLLRTTVMRFELLEMQCLISLRTGSLSLNVIKCTWRMAKCIYYCVRRAKKEQRETIKDMVSQVISIEYR